MMKKESCSSRQEQPNCFRRNALRKKPLIICLCLVICLLCGCTPPEIMRDLQIGQDGENSYYYSLQPDGSVKLHLTCFPEVMKKKLL